MRRTMKRFAPWLLIAYVIPYLFLCGYTGAGGIWARRSGQYTQQPYAGTRAGLQAAIDWVNAGGGGEIQVYPMVLAVDATISLRSNTAVYGAGIGSTILRRSGSGSYNVLSNPTFIGVADSNIVLRDLTIDGQRTLGTGQHGLRLTNVHKARVSRVKIIETNFVALCVYGTSEGPSRNRDVWLEDIVTDGSNDSGFDLTDIDGGYITRCNAYNFAQTGFNIEPRNSGGVVENMLNFDIGPNNAASSPNATGAGFGFHLQGNSFGTYEGKIQNCPVFNNKAFLVKDGFVASGSNIRNSPIRDNVASFCRNRGFRLYSVGNQTKYMTLSRDDAYNCGTDGSGTFSAFMDSNAVDCRWLDCYALDDNGSPKHKAGFEEKGSSDRNLFFGCHAVGYTTAEYIRLGAGTAVNVGTRIVLKPQVALTDAATIAIDAASGNVFTVTLAGNRAMGAPTNPASGQRITFNVIQDGTGARTLTWNAVFKVSWSDTGNTANKRSSISFIYDGTNWNQDGAQSPYI